MSAEEVEVPDEAVIQNVPDEAEVTDAPHEAAEDVPGQGEPVEAPEQIEGDDNGDELEPAEEPSAPHALSEKDIDARGQKLDKENFRHAQRVSQIMADDAPNLIPCPVCMDGIAGWVFLPEVQQLPPEAITRIRQLIGLPDLTTYQPAPFAMQCPDCAGMGEVKTGSLVNGFEVTICEMCKKQGWVRTSPFGSNGVVMVEPPTLVTGPTVAGPEQPDPEIAHLRERGFTVIPPMQLVQG
jgi:hypothetical protein